MLDARSLLLCRGLLKSVLSGFQILLQLGTCCTCGGVQILKLLDALGFEVALGFEFLDALRIAGDEFAMFGKESLKIGDALIIGSGGENFRRHEFDVDQIGMLTERLDALNHFILEPLQFFPFGIRQQDQMLGGADEFQVRWVLLIMLDLREDDLCGLLLREHGALLRPGFWVTLLQCVDDFFGDHTSVVGLWFGWLKAAHRRVTMRGEGVISSR